jgi:hypothetical protein
MHRHGMSLHEEANFAAGWLWLALDLPVRYCCCFTCRCPEMAELLQHCGPEVFDGPLPWDGTA